MMIATPLARASSSRPAIATPASPSVPFRRSAPFRPSHAYHRKRAVAVMVKTESQDVTVGEFQLPDFELLEPLTGAKLSSKEHFAGAPASLVVFMCNHCPFVVLLKDALVALAKDYTPKGVKIVGISANSVETHPQDGPSAMKEDAEKLGYGDVGFRYLFDETQEVAKEFRAACTPEFYVFDAAGRLYYHGQFDDARPGNGVAPTGADVRSALDDVLAGRSEVSKQPVKRSLGCNVKWAPGNEPSYFHTVG